MKDNKKIYERLVDDERFMGIVDTISITKEELYTLNTYDGRNNKYDKPVKIERYKDILIILRSGKSFNIKDCAIQAEKECDIILIGEKEKEFYDDGYASNCLKYSYTKNNISFFSVETGKMYKKITINNLISSLVENEIIEANRNRDIENIFN